MDWQSFREKYDRVYLYFVIICLVIAAIRGGFDWVVPILLFVYNFLTSLVRFFLNATLLDYILWGLLLWWAVISYQRWKFHQTISNHG